MFKFLFTCIVFALAICGGLTLDTGAIQVPRSENSKYIVPAVKWAGGFVKDTTVKTMDVIETVSEEI